MDWNLQRRKYSCSSSPPAGFTSSWNFISIPEGRDLTRTCDCSTPRVQQLLSKDVFSPLSALISFASIACWSVVDLKEPCSDGDSFRCIHLKPILTFLEFIVKSDICFSFSQPINRTKAIRKQSEKAKVHFWGTTDRPLLLFWRTSSVSGTQDWRYGKVWGNRLSVFAAPAAVYQSKTVKCCSMGLSCFKSWKHDSAGHKGDTRTRTHARMHARSHARTSCWLGLFNH